MSIYSKFPVRERLDRDSMMFAMEKPQGDEAERLQKLHSHGASKVHDRTAYMHVPFCDKLCVFCGFMRKHGHEDDTVAYLKSVHKELDMLENSAYVKQGHFRSVYFGGGTPSLIPTAELARVIARVREVLRLDDKAEFTVESAVHTLDYDKFVAMHGAGATRLSFGVQTFNTAYRQRLGRVSTKEDVVKSIQNARKAGFKTLSADLLYRLPEQSLDDFRYDLELASELDLDGVSIYPLMELPNTPMVKMIEQGKIPPLGDQKLEIDQYLLAMDSLVSKGYHQDNITHFSKQSDQNLYSNVRWSGGDTLPIGAGAGGYIDGLAVMNHMATPMYERLVAKDGFGLMGVIGMSDCSLVIKNLIGQLNRCLLDPPPLESCNSIGFDGRFSMLLAEWINSKLIEPTDDGYVFTRSGKAWGKNLTTAVSALYRQCKSKPEKDIASSKETPHG